MQVANITPHYFHVLRRQMHRDFRKPLIIMTPKSLLRHKMAVSTLADFSGESHFRRILSDPNAPADEAVKRLVLCTGKLAYELIEARDKAGETGTSVVRLESCTPSLPSQCRCLKSMTASRVLAAGGTRNQDMELHRSGSK